MDELKLQGWRVRDDFDYQRGTDPQAVKVVTFHLDHHGPFTERFTLQEFGDGRSVNARIEALRAQLRIIGGGR